MVMRDENVSKFCQRHPGKGKLARDSVSAINNVCRAVHDDYLCRWRVCLAWAWPTARAKKYESRPVLCVAACRIRRCTSQRSGVRQERPPIDVYHLVDRSQPEPLDSLHLKVRYLEGKSSA
jgi:hypothetical protein